MQHRNKRELIPIHLHRAIDAIVETGSVTKAAALLHLTQAAISAQIKRLEDVLGGPVFEKSSSGLRLTERGKAELEYGRRMLSLNDQLLAYAGPHNVRRQLTIGMPPWISKEQLVDVFVACRQAPGGEATSFRCDVMKMLAEDLMSGRLDLAYLCESAIPPAKAVIEWQEPLHWIGATGLPFDDKAPVPLVTWYGTVTDRLGIKALEATGRRFTIAFSSPHISSRHAAVRAGIGYTLANARLIMSGLSIVSERHLPLTRALPSGVYMRSDLERERFEPVIRAFVKAIEPPQVRNPSLDDADAKLAFGRPIDRLRAG